MIGRLAVMAVRSTSRAYAKQPGPPKPSAKVMREHPYQAAAGITRPCSAKAMGIGMAIMLAATLAIVVYVLFAVGGNAARMSNVPQSPVSCGLNSNAPNCVPVPHYKHPINTTN